jgi:triacylglycerol lipase
MRPEAPSRPLVLVHGLLDTPRLFSRLERRLEGQHRQCFLPICPIDSVRFRYASSLSSWMA